jgi:hypothetical protein
MSSPFRCLRRFNYTVTKATLQLNFVGFASANLLKESFVLVKR